MSRHLLILLVALLANLALAHVPHGWIKTSPANPDHVVELVVAVKQRNVHRLDQLLLAVSDPDSPTYGQYYTNEEVHNLLAPHEESIETVIKYLELHGIKRHQIKHSPNSDFLVIDIPVRKLEKITGAKYHKYTHAKHGFQVTRTEDELDIPEGIKMHIDFLSPFSVFPPEKTTIMASDNNVTGVTPDFIRELYGIDEDHKFGHSKDNRMATAQFYRQSYSPDDLQMFYDMFNKDTPFNISSVEIIGNNNASRPGTEAELDMQYMTALGNNISTQFWIIDGLQPGSNENEPFLKLFCMLSNTSDEKAPYIMSVSYGDVENAIEYNYARRINVEFIKAGLRGISVVFSSGDGGVGGQQHFNCTNYVPTFPAGSPYVTSVGGTIGNHPEAAANFSSGGFSNYWPMPAYQKKLVKKYFSSGVNGMPDNSLFNQTGRGFPDVATQAWKFWIVQDKKPYLGVSGTSAASPTFSGILALLNDARLMAGKTPLGFLNPFLYKNADAFNDVTTGSNPGCGTDGFPAAAGWDPATGLGTPNFPKLLKAVMALP